MSHVVSYVYLIKYLANFMFYLKTESGKKIPLPYDESVNLGRGDLLDIDDKKVSRQQATVTAKREPEPHVAVTPVSPIRIRNKLKKSRLILVLPVGFESYVLNRR